MIEKSFLIDTNILVHAFDLTNSKKHDIAKQVIEQNKFRLVLSSQSLAEFYNVAKKKEINLEINTVCEAIDNIIAGRIFKKISYNHISVQNAIDLSERYSTHFWDALIATTMLENGVDHIYTENIKDFSKIPNIVAINPFEKE